MNLGDVLATRKDKTIYRNGEKCIKLFDVNFSKIDVLNEALNHARIESTDINIPKILEVSMIDGKWAITTQLIKGETLAQLMEKNPDKLEDYLNLFVDLQVSVQARTCTLLTKLKDKMNRKISLADIDDATRYDLHTRLEGMPKSNVICHGDFNPSNIIIDEKGKPFIIDWSHVTQGHGAADAARTYLLFCLNGEFELADKYLDLFCVKSNIERKLVQKWMPIVAASQSVKGNEKEREFLLNWVNVVDYD